jgi:hypothetical protein
MVMTEKRQLGSVEQMEEQAHQQWGTVGGNKIRKPLGAQHPDSSDTQVPGLLDTQAPRKPERKRQTVYLYSDLYKWIRHYATDTDQEISDIVNEALKQYRAAHEAVKRE